MNAVDSLIEAMGGAVALAKALELPASTVGSWKSRSAISVEHWPRLVEAARARGIDGVTFEALTFMHARPRKASSPVPGPSGEGGAYPPGEQAVPATPAEFPNEITQRNARECS